MQEREGGLTESSLPSQTGNPWHLITDRAECVGWPKHTSTAQKREQSSFNAARVFKAWEPAPRAHVPTRQQEAHHFLIPTNPSITFFTPLHTDCCACPPPLHTPRECAAGGTGQARA
jgi:hypothetical protein